MKNITAAKKLRDTITAAKSKVDKIFSLALEKEKLLKSGDSCKYLLLCCRKDLKIS